MAAFGNKLVSLLEELPISSSSLKMRVDEDRMNAPFEEKVFYVVEALLAKEDPLHHANSKVLWSRLPELRVSEVDSESEFESIDTA